MHYVKDVRQNKCFLFTHAHSHKPRKNTLELVGTALTRGPSRECGERILQEKQKWLARLKVDIFSLSSLIALLSLWQVQKELEDMKKKYEELKAEVSTHSNTRVAMAFVCGCIRSYILVEQRSC